MEIVFFPWETELQDSGVEIKPYCFMGFCSYLMWFYARIEVSEIKLLWKD